MQQRTFILSLFFFTSSFISLGSVAQDVTKNKSQKKFSLHGSIKSQKTGETIIGASVSVTGYSVGAVSNDYGFYSLTLPTGDYSLEISAIGMKSQQVKISLNKDIKLDISLEEGVTNLQEVTVRVSTTGRSLKNPQMSVEKINVQEVRTIPVIFGEKDILKTIQLLP